MLWYVVAFKQQGNKASNMALQWTRRTLAFEIGRAKVAKYRGWGSDVTSKRHRTPKPFVKPRRVLSLTLLLRRLALDWAPSTMN